MKTHIPFAEDEAQAQRVLKAICDFIEYPIPAPSDQVRRIDYTHNGQPMSAEVGKYVHAHYSEPCPTIIAIIYSLQYRCYAICLRDRGVARGAPILVGEDSVSKVSYFEEEDEAGLTAPHTNAQ
jgi:hypothetical protein